MSDSRLFFVASLNDSGRIISNVPPKTARTVIKMGFPVLFKTKGDVQHSTGCHLATIKTLS